MDLKNIIESLIFVSKDPITMDRLKSLLTEFDPEEIKKKVKELKTDYDVRNSGIQLDEIAGGFQFRTSPGCKQWVKRMSQNPPLRISRAALETLAIVAYKQPVIRSDVEYIRGVDSGAVIRNLLDLKLIKVLGRKDIPGRPLIYSTTRYFLEIFGLNDIKDLPTLKEIDELEIKKRDQHSSDSIDEEKIIT